MSVEFRRTSAVDEVREFFWRIRVWPWPTKEEYYRYWDWRYTALADGEPTIFLASEGKTVVGHIALHPRGFCLDGVTVRGAVPGNFRVDPAQRSTLVGPRLATALRSTVHGYEQWEAGMLERLNGQFAFAIHDATNHTVMLARDRFGVRPLFYAMRQGNLFFGSEIKAILASGVTRSSVSMNSCGAASISACAPTFPSAPI